MFKFDKVDIRNAMCFVTLEVLLIMCIGGYMHFTEKVDIPITDEYMEKTMECQKLEYNTLPVPKGKKAHPQVPKSNLQKPKKKRRVYPISSRIIKALCYKESGNNPDVEPGDGGKAIGILQIHAKYLEDVNVFFGLNYSHSDMEDPDIAKHVTELYLGYYGYHLYSKGVEISDEVLCRLHNGGPSNYYDNGSNASRNTKCYWNDIKSRGLL